ncbi:uncharacterized protein LOC134220978 isoform X2 [Armigeres subalbatus]|uniref:uncharacterized protein LOC134220978 isoform X2 n=1 Tax=Armigeres subalbatus TaxID=124917 RepID=UPI002ED3C158
MFVAYTSGKPARSTDVLNEDWVPSLGLPESFSDSNSDSVSLISESSSTTSNSSLARRSNDHFSSQSTDSKNSSSSHTQSKYADASGSRLSSRTSARSTKCGDSILSQSLGSDNLSLLEDEDTQTIVNCEKQISIEEASIVLSNDTENYVIKPAVFKENVPVADNTVQSDLVSNDDNSILNASLIRKEVGVQVGARCFPAETFTQYYKEIIRLQEHNYRLENQISQACKGIEFLVDDAKCNYYTGIEKLSIFAKLYQYLTPSLDEPYCKFSQDQMLVMTLS